MRIKQLCASAAFAAAAATAPMASGAAMTGFIGFGDGLESVQNLPNQIVQGLTTIDMFNGANQSLVGPCLGDFSSLGCPTTGQATDFTFGAADQIVFTAGSFVFHFTLVPTAGPNGVPLSCTPLGTAQQCSDKWTFDGTGYVHDNSNAFDDTLILISFALTGNCIDSNKDNLCDSNWGGTYASSITATGQLRQVPEPGTLALAGLALAGLGFARRRKQ
jgi:hypothetical protein